MGTSSWLHGSSLYPNAADEEGKLMDRAMTAAGTNKLTTKEGFTTYVMRLNSTIALLGLDVSNNARRNRILHMYLLHSIDLQGALAIITRHENDGNGSAALKDLLRDFSPDSKPELLIKPLMETRMTDSRTAENKATTSSQPKKKAQPASVPTSMPASVPTSTTTTPPAATRRSQRN